MCVHTKAHTHTHTHTLVHTYISKISCFIRYTSLSHSTMYMYICVHIYTCVCVCRSTQNKDMYDLSQQSNSSQL